jgi:hypothetical protein
MKAFPLLILNAIFQAGQGEGCKRVTCPNFYGIYGSTSETASNTGQCRNVDSSGKLDKDTTPTQYCDEIAQSSKGIKKCTNATTDELCAPDKGNIVDGVTEYGTTFNKYSKDSIEHAGQNCIEEKLENYRQSKTREKLKTPELCENYKKKRATAIDGEAVCSAFDDCKEIKIRPTTFKEVDAEVNAETNSDNACFGMFNKKFFQKCKGRLTAAPLPKDLPACGEDWYKTYALKPSIIHCDAFNERKNNCATKPKTCSAEAAAAFATAQGAIDAVDPQKTNGGSMLAPGPMLFFTLFAIHLGFLYT